MAQTGPSTSHEGATAGSEQGGNTWGLTMERTHPGSRVEVGGPVLRREVLVVLDEGAGRGHT